MVEDIEPAEYIRRRDDNDQWQLIDVREDWEIAIASIMGATVISMTEIPSRQLELDKERPVAVICHSGGRSGRVADFLFQHFILNNKRFCIQCDSNRIQESI